MMQTTCHWHIIVETGEPWDYRLTSPHLLPEGTARICGKPLPQPVDWPRQEAVCDDCRRERMAAARARFGIDAASYGGRMGA